MNEVIVQFLNQLSPLLVTIFAPIVVALIKARYAKIPTWMLPLSAPIIGVAGDALVTWVTGLSLTGGPVEAAFAGALGVFVREVVDQSKKALKP